LIGGYRHMSAQIQASQANQAVLLALAKPGDTLSA